jgi:hypothetical protein
VIKCYEIIQEHHLIAGVCFHFLTPRLRETPLARLQVFSGAQGPLNTTYSPHPKLQRSRAITISHGSYGWDDRRGERVNSIASEGSGPHQLNSIRIHCVRKGLSPSALGYFYNQTYHEQNDRASTCAPIRFNVVPDIFLARNI